MSQGVKWVHGVGREPLRNGFYGETWQDPFRKQSAIFRKLNMWSANVHVYSSGCSQCTSFTGAPGDQPCKEALSRAACNGQKVKTAHTSTRGAVGGHSGWSHDSALYRSYNEWSTLICVNRLFFETEQVKKASQRMIRLNDVDENPSHHISCVCVCVCPPHRNMQSQ